MNNASLLYIIYYNNLPDIFKYCVNNEIQYIRSVYNY